MSYSRSGTLTDKVPQFHLLAAGNPRPESVHISPLYQITVKAAAEVVRETETIADCRLPIASHQSSTGK